jgi:CHAT domain-containing protein
VHLPLPDREPLREVRRRAGDYLRRVIQQVPRLNPTTAQAETALRILLAKGRELLRQLTQDDDDRARRLQAAFRAAWPVWQAADWSNPYDPVPVVQMHCRDEATLLPLELLPLFDLAAVPEIRTLDDLTNAAGRFLGFASVVWRVTPAATPADHVLRNDPALPVQFLRHSRLPSALREEGVLASLDGYVRLEGPWPDREGDAAFRQALVHALYHGGGLDGAAAGDPPVQVQHFACHCKTSARIDDDYELILSTRRGGERVVKLSDLKEAYDDLNFAGDALARHRAVIILNACGSAFAFPKWFLNRGHRAFIGTETDVPDGVASGFAAAFYGRLLEHRRPLGEAVAWARRDLLRDFRNPLGLLYVMYGDVDLVVERARPGIYRALPPPPQQPDQHLVQQRHEEDG